MTLWGFLTSICLSLKTYRNALEYACVLNFFYVVLST